MSNKVALFVIPIVAYFAFVSFNKHKPKIADDKFYVSEDMGKTWQQQDIRSNEIVFSSLNFLSIAIDPNDSDIIYLGTRGRGLYRSNSRGEYWDKIGDKNGRFSGQANIYDIAIDPRNSQQIYLAAYQDRRGRLFSSQDGGESWNEIYVTSEEKHAIFSVIIDKDNSSIIYMGTAQGGLLKSDDGGHSWRIINWFEGTVSDIAINPFDSRIIYLSTFQEGIYKTVDGGLNWTSLWENMGELAGAELVDKIIIDSQNPDLIYAASEYGIVSSNDGGETWQEVNMVAPPKTVPVLSLAVDTENNNHLFYGAGSILYNSIDRGGRWAVNQLPDSRLQIKVIAIDPKNPKLIYVGMHK